MKKQLFLITMLLTSILSFGQVPTSERDALIAIYNSTNGTNWGNSSYNWNTSAPVSTWLGITVNTINGQDHVTHIILKHHNLQGTLPPEIGNFPYLVALDLQNNPYLTGGIPPEIGNLVNLTSLSFYNDYNMTGSIPIQITNLTNLDTLILSYCKFSGIIPDLSNLPLSNLAINNNDFQFGDFESEFSSYQNINTFHYFPMNKVATEIVNDMIVGDNYSYSMPAISGTGISYQWYKNNIILPGETGLTLNIVNAQISDAANYMCKASSTIMPNLIIERKTIHLYSTVITSDRNALIALYNATNGNSWTNNTNWNTSAPVYDWHGIEMIGNRVTSINLYHNNLTGSIPIEIGNLGALKSLNLRRNYISSSIPIEIGNLTNLKRLQLNQNLISGSFPTQIGNLTMLEFLDVGNNQLTGTIPTEIGNLLNLTDLVFWNNNLTGTIPLEIGNCINMVNMSLENNQLTGTIPANFSNFTSIQTFWMNGNQLSGDISNLFSSWTDLVFFSIGNRNDIAGAHNDFTGNLDLSNSPKLYFCKVDNTLISTLNIQNGNNTNMPQYYFDASNTPNLTCIYVDNVSYSNTNWSFVDPTSTFVQNTTQCNALYISEETLDQNIILYPNPTSGVLSIRNDDNIVIKKISILNALGQQVLESESVNTLDISNLPSGIYYVNFKSNKGIKTSHKIIKQ